MLTVQKGLVIREPWIDLLLSGQKTWEMRSQSVSYRGWIGLIRKGSGRVEGIARLIDVGHPLSPDEMVATFDKHRIPEAMIRSGEVAKWTVPWKLADVRVLRQPVSYRHPNGAITLFSLDPAVSAAVLEQLDAPVPQAKGVKNSPAAHRPAPPKGLPLNALSVATTSTRDPDAFLGETEVTEGNLKNAHFYLRHLLHRFPGNLVGGRDHVPPVMATVEAPGMRSTSTDICPRHRFFRDRSWTREFLQCAVAEAGDVVQVHEVEPYHYRVSLRKRGSV